MPASIINPIASIGESLIRVNNLAAHIGTEIRAIQQKLTTLSDVFQDSQVIGNSEQLIPDEYFTEQERDRLHAINTTKQCAMFNLANLERQLQDILKAAQDRQNQQQQDGGQSNDD